MTLTCDTAPVTDPTTDHFTNLRRIADELARVREEAKQRIDDLERERDAEIVRAIGETPGYGAISATARAARITRQRIDTIRRIARTKHS